MCDQHSTVMVKTRKPETDWWCLKHRESVPEGIATTTRSCRSYFGADDDWCLVKEVEVWHTVGIDECIAPIVDALNQAGVFTLASCCGHGTQPGLIALRDGRELTIYQGGEPDV